MSDKLTDDSDDTPESIAAQIAYFDAHADRFAAAHKFITNAAPVDRSGSKGPGYCVHRVSLNEHCDQCANDHQTPGA